MTFIIFGIVYLPYLILTKRYRYGLGNRLGILSKELKSLSSKGKVIWIHAVSVGEMAVAGILAPILRKEFPAYTIIFSSVTHTGNKIANSIAAPKEHVFYLPFDLSVITDKVVKIIKPEMFLCLETELWPNLITSLYRFNTKIILVNGRISNSSYKGYKIIKFIISRILKKFSLILVQSNEDKGRILNLGAPEEKVFVTGNLKFDQSLSGSTDRRTEIRKKLGLNEDDILLAAGSTHRGEEGAIIDCFSRLKKEYANLKLLIAPRHIERIQEIERIVLRQGLKSVRFSLLNVSVCLLSSALCPLIYILDTIGDLKAVYSASDIVFVGGSLVKKGGQNPIEPANLAKPIILGRWTFNFHDVVKSFLENSACIQVENEAELYLAVKLLLDDPQKRKALGVNAKSTVDKNLGSSHLTLKAILSII